MNKDKKHIQIRNKIEELMDKGLSIEKIAKKLNLELGTRFIKGTVKWYRYCVRAKQNQKKAIEKHPNLYSKAGKIAQQKHPWIGYELGKKYAKIMGKRRMEQLRKQGKISEYFSKMSKKQKEMYPKQSRKAMKKAHETMKKNGTFYKHQREAAFKCMEKHPNQFKEMSKKAHELYPLALLALESRRRNYPYEFMNCFFDSNEERKLCKIFVEMKLMEKPVECKNIHFRIKRCHIDFFLKNKVFVEYHPPRKFGRKIETLKSYYDERRKLLDENGYKNYPLIIFDRLRNTENKLNKIKSLIFNPPQTLLMKI